MSQETDIVRGQSEKIFIQTPRKEADLVDAIKLKKTNIVNRDLLPTFAYIFPLPTGKPEGKSKAAGRTMARRFSGEWNPSLTEEGMRQWVEENPDQVNFWSIFVKSPLFRAVQHDYPMLVTWLSYHGVTKGTIEKLN